MVKMITWIHKELLLQNTPKQSTTKPCAYFMGYNSSVGELVTAAWEGGRIYKGWNLLLGKYHDPHIQRILDKVYFFWEIFIIKTPWFGYIMSIAWSLIAWLLELPCGCINIKIPSYQCRKSILELRWPYESFISIIEIPILIWQHFNTEMILMSWLNIYWDRYWCTRNPQNLGPLLLTWINFNPYMDKSSHAP